MPYRHATLRGSLAAGIMLVAFHSWLTPQEQNRYPPLEGFLRVERPRLTIGSEDREGPDLFGSISGVSADGMGNVYVLDGTDLRIRSFTSTGRYIAVAGNPGRGPGDLRYPLGLWHDGASSLFVVDQYDGISVFSTTGGKMSFRRRFGAGQNASALCTFGDELIVSGVRDGHVLHVLGDDGAVLRSFGEPFRRDTIPGIQKVHDTAELKLGCDDSQGRIYVAEGAQNRVRAYGRDGSLQWQTELPEYDGYSVRINRDPPGIAVFWGRFLTKILTPVGQSLLVVQASHETRRRDPQRGGGLATTDHGVVTYVLAAATGKVLTRQLGVPFLAVARGDEMIGFEQDPFPRVHFLRVTAR